MAIAISLSPLLSCFPEKITTLRQSSVIPEFQKILVNFWNYFFVIKIFRPSGMEGEGQCRGLPPRGAHSSKKEKKIFSDFLIELLSYFAEIVLKKGRLVACLKNDSTTPSVES